jgi:hypothetical protein
MMTSASPEYPKSQAVAQAATSIDRGTVNITEPHCPYLSYLFRYLF